MHTYFSPLAAPILATQNNRVKTAKPAIVSLLQHISTFFFLHSSVPKFHFKISQPLRFYTFFGYNILMALNRITLQLRNSKSSELDPNSAAQLFSALPETKKPWLPFSSPEAIAFEILCINQTIYFQINAPKEMEHYLRSQIHAAYPETLIQVAPHEVGNFPSFMKGVVKSTTLKLNHGSFYPLKTFKDFSETDPLSTILGLLSKLAPEQSALIQILVAPCNEKWKSKGYNLAAGTTDSEGKNTPHPFKTQIETKLAQISHQTAIKIATSTPDSLQSQNLLESIAKTFASISSAEGNKLTPHVPLLKGKQLTNSLQYREFTATSKQYFSVEELATIYHLPNQQLKNIKNIAWGKNLLGEAPENLPTFDTLSEEESGKVNFFAQTEHKNVKKIFGIKDVDRRRHIYVMGKTGTGKSTLLANMIISDLKKNKGIAVVDPHGDLVETVLNYIPSHRINDVVYLNPADPEYAIKLNLLEAKDAEHKELVSSGIIAIFKKLYGNSWGPRLEHILRNTLLTLITRDQSTLEDVVKILTNNKYRKKVLETLDDPVLYNFWSKEFASMGDRFQAEAVSPILNKVGQFVSSPLIRNVIDTPTNSFSVKEVMDEGKILLCNLSQGKLGEDNSALLGAMLITKIQLTAMSRVYIPEEERRDFYLFVDEFQNFATTSFIKILSEARKYRLSLVLANQYIDQIDEDVRKAIFGNCGSIMSFIVGAADADHLSKEYGGQYTPEDLVSLDRYQIITKISIDGMTSNPFPSQTLDLASSTNQNKDKVIKVSQERYAKKRQAPPTRQIQNTPKPDSSNKPKPSEGQNQNKPQKPKPDQPKSKLNPNQPKPPKPNLPTPKLNIQPPKPVPKLDKPHQSSIDDHSQPHPHKAKQTQQSIDHIRQKIKDFKKPDQ